MTERIFERLDRLGAEAGITEMTPALRWFALLVRNDMLAHYWPVPQPAQEPCDHRYFNFGTEQKRRRCVNCNELELEALAQPAQEPLTEVQIQCGLMALLRCSASDLDNYSYIMIDHYTDDVKRVVSAIIQNYPEKDNSQPAQNLS